MNTVEIIARRMEGGEAHEQLAWLRFERANGEIGVCSRAQLVHWIKNKIIDAEVGGLEVVVIDGYPPHVRALGDGVWSDDLLALPTF